MAKPVSMRETVQAVRDAHRVVKEALPPAASAHVHAAAFTEVLREFLDNEYVNDLGPGNPATGDRAEEVPHGH